MSKKETIVVVVVILLAGVLGIGTVALTKDKTSNKTETSQSGGHGDSHAASESESEETPQIDLTNQSEVTMDITDYKYAQANIKIKKGTKVTWTNQDTIEHNVMSSHEGDEAAHDGPPANEVSEEKLGSQLLTKGESYSFTFNEAGEFPYHCSPHPDMKGIVTVI